VEDEGVTDGGPRGECRVKKREECLVVYPRDKRGFTEDPFPAALMRALLDRAGVLPAVPLSPSRRLT
jgi:hypothetical protein